MAARKAGPKSRAEIEIESFMIDDGNACIEIPPELTSERDRELYRTFFIDNPSSHAFTKTVAPLLVQYVREKNNADHLNKRISELQMDRTKSDELLKFMKAHTTASASMMSLLTKLRATPSASAGYRGGPKTVKTGPKPWEC